ncbi:nuclear transport factor 2 family protein [Kocuria sp. CH-021]|uniref:nuclear transport factor 2 family protein n=1 Tax=Kocuria sp. CH-021 TaxID=3406735 RepID=UPI003C739280
MMFEKQHVVQLADMNFRFGELELQASREMVGETKFSDRVDAEEKMIDTRAEFQSYLDDEMVFRRGDGTIATKEEFLASLENEGNLTSELRSKIVLIEVRGTQAIVIILVYLKGTRNGKEIDATFRNIRLFEFRDDWKCVMWFNKPYSSDEYTSSENW